MWNKLYPVGLFLAMINAFTGAGIAWVGDDTMTEHLVGANLVAAGVLALLALLAWIDP